MKTLSAWRKTPKCCSLCIYILTFQREKWNDSTLWGDRGHHLPLCVSAVCLEHMKAAKWASYHDVQHHISGNLHICKVEELVCVMSPWKKGVLRMWLRLHVCPFLDTWFEPQWQSPVSSLLGARLLWCIHWQVARKAGRNESWDTVLEQLSPSQVFLSFLSGCQWKCTYLHCRYILPDRSDESGHHLAARSSVLLYGELTGGVVDRFSGGFAASVLDLDDIHGHPSQTTVAADWDRSNAYHQVWRL